MAPRDVLVDLLGEAIARATGNVVAGGSAAIWEREMRQALTTGYTAAYVAATAQRLGVSDPALISARRLSRAEKQDIAAAVDVQLPYLARFARELPELTPAAILARAQLYAGSLTPFYERSRWGDWDIPDQLLPGLQDCLGNCRCSIRISDNGDGTGVLTRTMGGEHHCKACPPLAGDHPVKRRGRA